MRAHLRRALTRRRLVLVLLLVAADLVLGPFLVGLEWHYLRPYLSP